jgi:hypothetical protein
MFRTFTKPALERERHASSLDIVAAVVLRALTTSRPKTCYLII